MTPRWLSRSFLLLGLLTLAAFLLLAGHAHPVADDFCYAAKARGLSLADWSFNEWMYWNGRYASNLLMFRNPLAWSPDFLPGYRAVPIALLLLTLLGCWFLLRRITRGALRTGHELLGALLFLLLYLHLMPDLGEGFYWYTGAVTYQLGSILLLFHLGLLFTTPTRALLRFGKLLANALLAAVITGMDEVHMLLMLALHAGLLAWRLRQGRGGRWEAALLLAITSAGALLMYLAPGNAVRGAMFAETCRLFPSLGMSALQAVRFIGTWMLSPALLAFSLLYVPVHRQLKAQAPAFLRLLRIAPWPVAALPVLLVMACTFPAYWSTGLLGQHRTINVACLFFIPLWFLNLSIWLERPALRHLAALRLPPRALGAALLLAFIGLNATRNGLDVHRDLLGGRAAEYDRALHQREAQVRAAALDPAATVVLTRLERPPFALPSYEEHGLLRSWMVHCEARYFGAEEHQVRMQER